MTAATGVAIRVSLLGGAALSMTQLQGLADSRFTLFPTGASFYTTFQELPESVWHLADYSIDNPDHHYDTGFSPEYVVRASDRVKLRIDRTARPPNSTTGAELRLRGERGYGRYEVVMKPARGDGVVSSFFTWTGPFLGTPHDEIDIEFIGRDTTLVSLNLFADGQALPQSKKVQLPFDAADSFNLYAFEWSPDAVHWYVNDERVYSVYASERPIPTNPGIVMANIWTGARGQWAWHGPPRFTDGASAEYRCISYKAHGDNTAQQCSDSFPDG